MAKKVRTHAYTIPYFIRFFSEIPASHWVCGEFTNACAMDNVGTRNIQLKACAMGFAGAYKVKKVYIGKDSDEKKIYNYVESKPTTPVRLKALNALLNNLTAEINDANAGYDEFYKLGKTPRARILKALRLRQKYGTDWESHI